MEWRAGDRPRANSNLGSIDQGEMYLFSLISLSFFLSLFLSCRGPSIVSYTNRVSVTAPLSSFVPRRERQNLLRVQNSQKKYHEIKYCKGPYTPGRISALVFNAFFVFTPKRFSLTMSRVNMQIHSLTLDGA